MCEFKMAINLFVVLATATILAVGVSSFPSPLEAPPTVSPDITINSYNSSQEADTYSGWGFSQYLYLDFPKIGYAIFKRKMLNAFKTMDLFMQMKPAYLKISKYFLHSDTKNDTLCLLCAGLTDEEGLNTEEAETSPESEENAETNQPQTIWLPEVTKVLHEIEPQSDPTPGKEDDEVKRTKIEPEGFFSKGFSRVSGVFSKIGSLFG